MPNHRITLLALALWLFAAAPAHANLQALDQKQGFQQWKLGSAAPKGLALEPGGGYQVATVPGQLGRMRVQVWLGYRAGKLAKIEVVYPRRTPGGQDAGAYLQHELTARYGEPVQVGNIHQWQGRAVTLYFQPSIQKLTYSRS